MKPSGFNGTKPEFTDVVRSIIDNVLLDLNVCLPGKVVRYDKSTQYGDVEIQLLQSFNQSTLVPYPVIPNVAFRHPRAKDGTAFIHMPVATGDDVMLVFSQRSLDNWKTQGGMSDPNDPRKHHITDAYAILGGSAIPDSFKPTTDDAIEIVNGTSKLNVFPDGKFQMMNPDADLLTQLQLLAETLSTDTVNTIFGPMQLNAFATYEEIAIKLLTLVK